MKTIFKFLSAVLVIVSIGLTACSNKDDEPKNFEPPVEPSYKNVLSQGLPTEVDGYSFTTDDYGHLTSINSDNSVIATFHYLVNHWDLDTYSYLVGMWTNNHNVSSDISIDLNNQGYIIQARAYPNVIGATVSETWEFEYNSDGQLIRMNSSDEGVFKITYTNGDISKVEMSDNSHTRKECIFNYTNDEYPEGIPNKGNIMLYDYIYKVDMDVMELAYFAGILGKSTNHLPLECIESGKSHKYNWVLNHNGLPTKLNNEINFTWE